MLKSYPRIIFINVLIALSYWGISHLNWMFFHKVGILPMPVWPAAALALLAGLIWGWTIAPALAAGTILANHFSLGAAWAYSACTAVMNTLGPLTAAWLIHRYASVEEHGILKKVFGLIAAGLLLAPAMTASGGVGSQWILGMIQSEEIPVKWLRWFISHSVGTLIFVCPVLVFYPSIWRKNSQNKKNEWLDYAGKTTLVLTAALALLIWFGDALLNLLWFKRETGSPAETFFPVYSLQELWSRIFVFVTILFAGGAVSKLLKNLAESHKSLEESNRALKESEELQRTLLANLPAGVIIIDPLTKIIESVNSTASAMFGREKEYIIGHRCHSFLCPANEGACPICDLGQAFDNTEREMIRADGSIHPVLKSVKYVKILGKAKLLECFVDITETKKAEKALEQKTALLEAQLNTALDGILVIDKNQKRLIINNRIIEQWNVPQHILDDEDDRALLDYVTGLAKYPDQFIEKVMYLYDHPHETSRDEIEFKNGMILDRYSAPVIGRDGRYYGRIWTFRDITARKQAEKAWRESEARLRRGQHYTQLLLDTSPVYIVAIAFDGRTLMMNKALLDAVEYAREEIIGLDYLASFVPEEDHELLAGVFQQIVKDKKATINENRIISKSGKIYPVEWYGRTVIHEEEDFNFFVGIGIDITARQKYEQEKKELEDQLIQAHKMDSIGRLAGGIAHDFNNMLNIILGYTALILTETGEDNPFHAYLEEIKNAAEHSADMTKQLLAFARKQTVSPKILNLNNTIEEMLNMLQRLIGEDIDLAWLPHKDLWHVNIDPAQIDQVLVNLLVNSRDAIEGVGKITIETNNIIFDESYCAMHKGFKPGEFVMLAVTDTGCGMDEETLVHIYEPFYTTKNKGKGIGLGMATVYGIIKQNDGFINVYSEPGKGTTIKIYLPGISAKYAASSLEDTAEEVTGGHETILLVEDEPATLKLGQIILEGLGYVVLAANTPGEALRKAEENSDKIHLLITDVVMPEMNGRDLADKLLSLYPSLKLMFMSGYTENVIAHHGILDEGVNFIQKPFSRNTLAAKVRKALDV